jgi:hypothetical protein
MKTAIGIIAVVSLLNTVLILRFQYALRDEIDDRLRVREKAAVAGFGEKLNEIRQAFELPGIKTSPETYGEVILGISQICAEVVGPMVKVK